MKDEKFNKGIEGLRQAALSPAEKSAMLSRIHAYADFHKAKIAAPVAPKGFHFFALHRYSYGTLALLLVLSTSSVSLAAEKALPGDILYPIKVNINESVRSALTVSPEAKARWEADKIFRRVEEAETLAAQGKLDDASLLEVESRIDMHFESFSTLSSRNNPQSGASAKSAASEIPSTIESARIAPQAQTMMLAVPAEDSANYATGAASATEMQVFQAEAKTEPREGSFNSKVEKHKTILQNIMSPGNSEQNLRLEKLQRKLDEKSEEGLRQGLELSAKRDDSLKLEAAAVNSSKNTKSEKKTGKSKKDD